MKGNAVMKAKRVTGPTPNTVLVIAVACETCDHCASAPLRTSSVDGSIHRACVKHLNGKGRKQAEILSTGWKPPWM